MRKALIVTALSLAAVAACDRKPADAPRPPAPPGSAPTSSGPKPVSPAAMPARAPGLWEQKISAQGMAQVSRICLDKAVEQRFTVWGQQASQGACNPTQITPRFGGGWEFVSSCDMGENGKTKTHGQVTGDFAKAYKVTAESTTSGARAPQMNGTHAMTLQASWQGPCPAGMQPGDMTLPGGMKINMMQIPAS